MKRNLVFATFLTVACLVLAVITLAFSGCRSLLPSNIVNPTYALRSVRPHVAIALPLTASAIDLDFTIVVDNPNPIGLNLAWLDFDLDINDHPILTSVRAEQGVHIPAHGMGDVHLRTRIGYASLKSLFREVAEMVEGNRAHYTVRGNAYYDTPFGQKRFPLTLYSR